jgi:hypothetical protein
MQRVGEEKVASHTKVKLTLSDLAPLACSAAPLIRSLSICHLSLLGTETAPGIKTPAGVISQLYKIDHSIRRGSNLTLVHLDATDHLEQVSPRRAAI